MDPPPNTTVQFADRSPSIIPSPLYHSPAPPSSTFSAATTTTTTTLSSSSSMSMSSSMVPPPSSSHLNRTTVTGAMHRSHFASDTFQQEKTLHEESSSASFGARYEHEDEEHELHTRGRSFLGGSTTQGFLPLATHEEDDDPMAPTRHVDTPTKRHNPVVRFLVGPTSRPWFSWASALVMLVILIVELVRNATLTGSVIQTSPSFNPMIGPSFYTLITMGAKFTPCMRPMPNYTPSMAFSDCYKTGDTCTLTTLCESITPPSARFFTPIFMHAGIVHYLMNMLTHLRLGVDLERALGLPRYVMLYLGAGLFGNVLSSMLAQPNQASMGASGSLFGLIGYMFVDVLVHWKNIPNPVRELMALLISTVISLVLGLLPGLDNFAHLGGFVVGLVMGMLIAPMRPMASPRGRWITWALRVIAFVLLIVLFAVCITTFYNSSDPAQICPGCKYLSCLPVNNWCDY